MSEVVPAVVPLVAFDEAGEPCLEVHHCTLIADTLCNHLRRLGGSGGVCRSAASELRPRLASVLLPLVGSRTGTIAVPAEQRQ